MRGLGAAFGPGFPLSLITVIVPARQREPLIATSPVWPTHLDRTQPEPESYRRLWTHVDGSDLGRTRVGSALCGANG